MALALIAPFITLLATPVSAETAPTAAEPAFKVAAAALLQPSAPAAKPAPPDARFKVLVVRSTQDAVSSPAGRDHVGQNRSFHGRGARAR